MACPTLILSFAPLAAGRERAEALLSELLEEQNLGQITGGGEDLQTGAFDIEISTNDGETLFHLIQSVLEDEPGLDLKDATLIER